jgi:hypothetical protein
VKAPFWRQWQAMLFEDGFAGLTWPKEYGGQGLSEKCAAFTEECDRTGVPERLNIIGEDFAGPTIAHFGTDAQKQRYLRPILTGEEIWCQLFSEPDSGSNLASLRTKAVKADGGWRISGAEDLDQPRAAGSTRHPPRPHRRRRAAAGYHLFPAPDGQRRRDRAAARAHARRGSSTRASSMTSSCPTTRWWAWSTHPRYARG